MTPEFRNPPHLRGITGPPSEPAEPWTPVEYKGLLAHFQESLRLKQRALSAEHTSLHFGKFETVRLLVEAGRAKEAAKPMGRPSRRSAPRWGRVTRMLPPCGCGCRRPGRLLSCRGCCGA